MDERTREAVSTVAHRVAARILATYDAGEEWENHPDIGEHDWQRVVERLSWLAGYTDVSDQDYDAAYEHLTGRARPTTSVALVVVDDRGHLIPSRDGRPGSTVTVGDETWSVPNKVEHGGVLWMSRVGYALREFGWRPASGVEIDDSRRGVIGVPVERIETRDG